MSNYTVNGLLSNYGFCVKKNTLDKNILEIFYKYFRVKPELNYEDVNKTEEQKSFDTYYEDDNYIVLPKFTKDIIINIPKFNNKHNLIINDIEYKNIDFTLKRFKYKKQTCEFQFKGNLREQQQLIIYEIFNKFGLTKENPSNHDVSKKFPKGGLLKLSVGFGKTVLAIYLSYILKLKTLIVVHKEFLMDQWIERYKHYTNAKVGIIRQNKVDIEGKDVVIGMLRSLSTKDYGVDVFNQFGLVIYDEVHHLGSRVDSQALLKTSSEYTIGLSATPERSDGMLKIINWHIGPILYQVEKQYNFRVLVKKIFFRSEDPLFIEKKKWFQGRFAPNHTTMFDNITKIKKRNQLIIQFINTLKSLGRKILILSYRVEHLEELKRAVDKQIADDEENHIYNSYFYMGKTKKGEKKLAEKDGDIIFATMQLAEEGLDIPHLDTVLFALPVSVQKDKHDSRKIKSNKTLIQSIGRILRNDKLENLTQIPLVIDISDQFSIYSGWSKKRNEVYYKKNWYLQNYYFDDLTYNYEKNQDKDTKPMNILFDDIQDEEFIENNLIVKDNEVVDDDESENTSSSNNSLKSNKSSSSDNAEIKVEQKEEPIYTFGKKRIS
jgi:superfamily II DNA or RNA helicase